MLDPNAADHADAIEPTPKVLLPSNLDAGAYPEVTGSVPTPSEHGDILDGVWVDLEREIPMPTRSPDDDDFVALLEDAARRGQEAEAARRAGVIDEDEIQEVLAAISTVGVPSA